MFGDVSVIVAAGVQWTGSIVPEYSIVTQTALRLACDNTFTHAALLRH